MRQSSFSQEPPTSNNDAVDAMRHDIDAMKREAERRLEALSHDLQEFQTNKQQQDGATNRYLDAKGDVLSSTSLDCMEGDLTKVTTLMQQAEDVLQQRREQEQEQKEEKHANKISNTSEPPVTSVIMHKPSNVHLLENTRVSRKKGMSDFFTLPKEKISYEFVLVAVENCVQSRS